jgi:hypothetical protein
MNDLRVRLEEIYNNWRNKMYDVRFESEMSAVLDKWIGKVLERQTMILGNNMLAPFVPREFPSMDPVKKAITFLTILQKAQRNIPDVVKAPELLEAERSAGAAFATKQRDMFMKQELEHAVRVQQLETTIMNQNIRITQLEAALRQQSSLNTKYYRQQQRRFEEKELHDTVVKRVRYS